MNFLRRCVGSHIEVLGRLAQQQIAHSSANDIGFETRVLQLLDHFSRMGTQFPEGNPVPGLVDFCKSIDKYS